MKTDQFSSSEFFDSLHGLQGQIKPLPELSRRMFWKKNLFVQLELLWKNECKEHNSMRIIVFS